MDYYEDQSTNSIKDNNHFRSLSLIHHTFQPSSSSSHHNQSNQVIIEMK